MHVLMKTWTDANDVLHAKCECGMTFDAGSFYPMFEGYDKYDSLMNQHRNHARKVLTGQSGRYRMAEVQSNPDSCLR